METITHETDAVRTMRSSTIELPITAADLIRQRHALKRALLRRSNLLPTRVAILGGSTTFEVREMLELFLLTQGIQPSFYESEYNRYSETLLLKDSELKAFSPDIVFIHTTFYNVSGYPATLEDPADVELRIASEMARFEALWQSIHADFNAVIIQNNFDFPRTRPIGNLEATEPFGRLHFLSRLNAEFAAFARTHSRFIINDILYLSAQVGLNVWFDYRYWYGFHMAVSPTGTVALARNVAAIIKSLYGKSKKCLVLDLDNTLWGGVIGDDGVQKLLLGREHPAGEAFLDFQRYVKELKERGIVLAVCSKNDPENAKDGFSHPDSVLKLEDFSAFKANWSPKPENIRAIAAELNLGLSSLVFVDDNPAERSLVAEQLPEVCVPDVGSDVMLFAEILERERYFETEKIVADDVSRSAYYNSNAQRYAALGRFVDYGEFLASLDMIAEIGPFCPVYLDRITQLINKTNQFNLTTRRYTSAEVEAVSRDPDCIALYGKLSDRFGDNGLVSVVIGRVTDNKAQVDTWLMSCRVLKRDFELAMFDAFVEQCRRRDVNKIEGFYARSKKNGIVAEHYAKLGFEQVGSIPGDLELWTFEVTSSYALKNRHIRISAQELTSAR